MRRGNKINEEIRKRVVEWFDYMGWGVCED